MSFEMEQYQTLIISNISGEETQVVSESISIPQAVTGAATAAKNIFRDFTESFKNIVFPTEDTVFDTVLNRYQPPSLSDTLLNRYDPPSNHAVRYAILLIFH